MATKEKEENVLLCSRILWADSSIKMDKIFGANLEFVREDDYVEYFIFPKLNSDQQEDTNDDTAIHKQLEDIRTKCLDVVKKLTKERNYIWHKDEFELRVRTCTEQELLLNDESTTTTKEKAPGHQGMFENRT